MRKLLLYICVLLCIGLPAKSQTYLMQNGTINTCTGTFYDTGGSSGNHGMGEVLTMTFCSPPGSQISIRFTTFSIGTGAIMNIYDGPNTSGTLLGTYNSTASVNSIGGSANGTITASCRCITIVFISGATTGPGWAATISCGAIPTNGMCTNMGFETGTTTGWYGRTGTANALMCGCNPGFVGGRHTIMTGAGVDPFGGFPVVAPAGGSYSFRLGNSSTGGQAEQLIQKYQVTNANTYFVYKYAVVLEDPGHTAQEQPFFRIRMFAGPNCDTVSCGQYFVAASAGIAGFQDFPPPPATRRGIYKTWTTVGVDLSPYVGQEVTLEFTTGDCSQSAHFGYAYIDGGCGIFTINASDSTICNPPVSLCAPAGYATYNWSPGAAATQCITATAAGTYTVTMNSLTNCVSPSTLSYVVKPCAVPLKLTAFTAADLQNTSVLLTWKTASESSANRFDVERSIDGSVFEKIGEVKGSSSSGEQNYQMLDDNIGSDILSSVKVLYYRLKQIDNDGAENHSSVVTVKLNKKAALLEGVSFNTVNNNLNYKVNMDSPGTITVRIFDVLGKILHQEQKQGAQGVYELATDVGFIPAGAYFLQVVNDKGASKQQLFIK